MWQASQDVSQEACALASGPWLASARLRSAILAHPPGPHASPPTQRSDKTAAAAESQRFRTDSRSLAVA
jgi:hypothetical protein